MCAQTVLPVAGAKTVSRTNAAALSRQPQCDREPRQTLRRGVLAISRFRQGLLALPTSQQVRWLLLITGLLGLALGAVML